MNKENELLINLLNKILESQKKKRIQSLNDLVQEKFLRDLLVEIEPKLEKIGGKIEINDDANFGIRYANIVSILNCLEKYLQKSPEKERFAPTILDFKNIIIINDLLKNDQEQIINLAEILLFLSSISSKKDYYLDKISEFEDIKYVNAFFIYIEKYIVLDNKIDETNNLNQSHLDRSYMLTNQVVKMKDEYEREKDTLIRNIRENDKEMKRLNNKNEVLEKNYTELELKYKDKEREFEIAKYNQNYNMRVQEEMFKDNITNSELISQLNQKDAELNDLKRENELVVKRMNEETKKLKEKLDSCEDKLADSKSLKAQNEKLNLKVKELTITKERNQEYEELRKTLDSKNKQIETLIKEKQTYAAQIEKINKESLIEKEKARQTEFDKKKLEYDLNELKRDYIKLEVSSLRSMNINTNFQTNLNNISEVRKNPPNLNNSELVNEDMKLFDLGGDSMIFDDLKDLNLKNKNHYTEKEFFELKNEKNELVKLYKSQIDEIHKLVEEKDRLLNTIDSYKYEVDKHNSEKERLGIEKEKLQIQIQKIDLDCQKLKIHIERHENEKKRMEEEIKELNEKVEYVTGEKNNKQKESEQFKTLLNTNKTLADKILSEKQAIIKDYQNLQAEFDKFKQSSIETINLGGVNGSKNKKISPKNNLITSSNNNVISNSSNTNILISELQTEITLLKNEISTLKLNNTQKEDTIKTLKEKLKLIECATDNTEKISQDLVKRSEDLDFYKRSYEEQKNRVNKEHEMISSSLYELALQFMSLKNELQKKITNETSGKK